MRSSILIAGLFVALLAAVIVVIELVRIPSIYQVEGNGVVKYRPDAARLTVGAYFESATSAEAVAQTATTMHNVLDALKAAGVADSDIATKGVASGPKTDQNYLSSPQPKTPGYYAEQTLIVTIHDISRLGKLLDTINAAGSNNWEVNFFASDPTKYAAQARDAAFADAMTRADAFANKGGFRRGAVLKVMEGQASWPEPDYSRRDYTNTYVGRTEMVTVTGSRLPPRRDFAVPAPQEQSVTASVAVLFEIK